MSLDKKYIIQYEGPFGDDELDGQLKKLNSLRNSFGFNRWGYDTIVGEVKHSSDEDIIKISQESTPIQIMA